MLSSPNYVSIFIFFFSGDKVQLILKVRNSIIFILIFNQSSIFLLFLQKKKITHTKKRYLKGES